MSSQGTHQVLIASYAKDFPFLEHCLWSLKEFCVGFLPPVVSVSSEDFQAAVALADRVFPEAVVKVRDGRHGYGFMRAQLSMMEGDILGTGDFIWLVGSDCLLHSELSPAMFFSGGRPILMVNTLEHLREHGASALCWVGGTESLLGFHPIHEYMRQLPLVYPRELFGLLRSFISGRAGKDFDECIYSEWDRSRAVSESNLLGAFAYEHCREMYEWIDLDTLPCDERRRLFPNPLLQFWSHRGLDHVCDRHDKYFGGETFGKTFRSIIGEVREHRKNELLKCQPTSS